MASVVVVLASLCIAAVQVYVVAWCIMEAFGVN